MVAPKAFGAAFGLTFVAELGDKTQLAVLTLSARYGFWPVLLGAALAFVILDALAVTVGSVIAAYVPRDVIRYLSAAVFMIFGVLSFRPQGDRESLESETEERARPRNPFIATFSIVALMELGDKTQLSLLALTSKYKAPFFIFLGGTLALWLATAIGALIGKGLARVVPLKWIRWGSGVIFIVFGILIAVGVI